MFLKKDFITGPLVAIFGKPVSFIATKGVIIWQSISKYWHRRDKWKSNQKW
jgi:hypothetical protein